MNTTNKQQGLALIVSLIMLLLMSLLAINGMKTTILEEKITANYKNRNTAFQAAEASLRAGEDYIENTDAASFSGSTAGLYRAATAGAPQWGTVDWDDASKIRDYSSLADVDNPKYIIEELPVVPPLGGPVEAGVSNTSSFYRVTTTAVGGTKSAVVILQTTYKH